jgi:3-oxoacyl-[acyl-carrier protein] reductase
MRGSLYHPRSPALPGFRHYAHVALVALITGVGRRRGIGASIAAGLAAGGWESALSHWRPYDDRVGHEHGATDSGELAKELRRASCKVERVAADPEDPASADLFGSTGGELLGST